MDAVRNNTLHPSETVHSLPCINTDHMDELSKEREEELLYGPGDDGDEEDALSDDSMRLRLSDDDEIETEDVVAPVLNNQENKQKNSEIEIVSGKEEDTQTSSVPDKTIMKGNTTSVEVKQEEHCSGNVSTDEKIVYDYEKDAKRNENRLMRQQTSNVPRPWPNYENQWRFSRNPGVRSFRNVSHPLYNRCRYLTPRGHFRHQLYEYNMRFHNSFLPFERGRGNGIFNSYNRSLYGNRHPKKGFKPSTIQKLNSSIEFDQSLASPSSINVSSKCGVNNGSKSIKLNFDNSSENDNGLNRQQILMNNDKNNEQSNKLLNEKLDDFTTDSFPGEMFNDTDPVTYIPKSLQNSKESTSVNVSDCTKPKSITVCEMNTLGDNSNADIVKETTNADAIRNKDGDLQETGKRNAGNKQETETDKKTDLKKTGCEEDKTVEIEAEKCHLSEVNNKVPKSEKNSDISILGVLKEDKNIAEGNNALIGQINITHTTGEISETQGDGVLKASCTVLNNAINEEDDSKLGIIQNDTLIKSVCHNKNCDNKQLNNSDNDTSSIEISKSIVPEDELISKIDLQQESKDTNEEHTNSVEKENSITNSANKIVKLSKNTESSLCENVPSNVKQLGSITGSKDNSGDNVKRTPEVPVATQRRRRRTKKMITAAQEAAVEGDKQVRESGRQKRRTAKNAEKIIREEFLLHDSDLEFSDSSEKLVAVNYKMSQDARPLSPPSLKRNCSDAENATINGAVKKVKINSEVPSDNIKVKENNLENIKKLNYIHKFFQRDLNEKLPKLKQEELEELLIQKIVETITMRDEIGRLREQARISERNQEITRAKCQQLAKQIKDFEMVLNRNAADRRANNDKPTPPIKINRSVGLQVNFITDPGMQNLRQLQQNSNMKSLHVSSSSLTHHTSSTEINTTTSPRRGIKIRSPRRTELGGQNPVVSQNSTHPTNIMSAITPAALVVAKPVDTQHSLALSNQSNAQQIVSNQQTLQPQPQQAIVLNGKFTSQLNRQGSTTVNVAKSRTNDLIDLTDEEEKSKGICAPSVANTITDQQVNITQKAQPCFPRVIQTIPGNVAITSQPPSIRVVQPASLPTPTALVNNTNAPRLAYVMQSGVGPTRQLLIAPNSSPIRPVTSCRASFSTLTYKTGISTIANGTVRVLTTPATSNIQLNKHPAPLPDTRNYAANPLWKLPPPAPSLKISKVANGIILSWNMNLSDKYADIASYQLYAYQEIAGVPPNTSLWKKVGDVRALPLPMACTLTQFSEGNNYYFAVRAVDTHSRKGQYSIPGNISL